MGEKWPVVDFLVELIGAGDMKPYFFAQVKTTREGYTRGRRRLKVKIGAGDMRRLASYPAPTYIVGVDDDDDRGEAYIVSANGEWMSNLPSLPTLFPVNRDNQDRLWEEVYDFWERVKSQSAGRAASRFVDPLWR